MTLALRIRGTQSSKLCMTMIPGCKITAEAQSEACHLKEMRPNYLNIYGIGGVLGAEPPAAWKNFTIYGVKWSKYKVSLYQKSYMS